MWRNAKESGEEVKLWPHLIQIAPYKDFTNLSIKQLDMSIKFLHTCTNDGYLWLFFLIHLLQIDTMSLYFSCLPQPIPNFVKGRSTIKFNETAYLDHVDRHV